MTAFFPFFFLDFFPYEGANLKPPCSHHCIYSLNYCIKPNRKHFSVSMSFLPDTILNAVHLNITICLSRDNITIWFEGIEIRYEMPRVLSLQVPGFPSETH